MVKDFLIGNFKFKHNLGQPLSCAFNEGILETQPGGYGGLLAPVVINSGKITDHLGSVTLASGKSATLDFKDPLANHGRVWRFPPVQCHVIV